MVPAGAVEGRRPQSAPVRCEAQRKLGERHRDETFQEKLVSNRLKIAASLRKSFDVDADEDFLETLFNNMF